LTERNIRLLLEYGGSPYGGWQQQRGRKTIQSELQSALYAVTGEHPVLHVASRTDAGVHASGQVLNFRIHSDLEARRFAPALNFHLPATISVHRSDEVSLDFHARHDAAAKRYRYRIYRGPQPAALERERSWHIRQAIDVETMTKGAACLIGEKDFNAFRSTQCAAAHARRHMYSIDIIKTARPPVGETIEILFHANAFCRYMCRILAGTLIEVGQGKRAADSIETILQGRDRRRAGVTAPPRGLTLVEVLYDLTSLERAN